MKLRLFPSSRTSEGTFSDLLKRVLDDSALHILRVEKFAPDLTGFLKRRNSTSKEIIIVEIKSDKIKIKDIAKAKLYTEVLDARFCILISPKPVSEEIRRFIMKRSMTSRHPRNQPVVIAQFDQKAKELTVDKELYYGTLPEPFKGPASS